MELDPVLLSRIQFALTIMFHYIFPPLSIGLGVLLVFMEGMYLKTKDMQYEMAAKFWTRIFAVNFAVGVATGIVMEFQFGTNWATYSRFVGDVFGSALAAEGIFAFFLESGFLALLVFGWDKVSPRMHFFSTVMVALGAMFSAIWIVVANSWQQTPAGYHLVETGGQIRAEITDFWVMVFNPSSMQRLVHVLLGSYLQAAFFVMSIAAYYLLKRRHTDFARKTFAMGLVLATFASLAQLVSGHQQARIVSEYQPAKLAAMEGHYRTEEAGTALYLFGMPDDREQRVKYGVALPGLLSWLVFTDARKPVTALDSFPPEDRPPVGITFQSYHLMIAIGMTLIGLSLLACFYAWRGTLFEQRWLMKVFMAAVILPYVANQAGWVAAEVGRQPWTVYGLLRTSDSVSKSVSGAEVLSSIIMFSFIYALLFFVWVFVLNAKIIHGPDDHRSEKARQEGVLEAVAFWANPSEHSLTGMRDDPDVKRKE
jgi:cytochrome bd ubiquinol oxidase subunit I